MIRVKIGFEVECVKGMSSRSATLWASMRRWRYSKSSRDAHPRRVDAGAHKESDHLVPCSFKRYAATELSTLRSSPRRPVPMRTFSLGTTEQRPIVLILVDHAVTDRARAAQGAPTDSGATVLVKVA